MVLRRRGGGGLWDELLLVLGFGKTLGFVVLAVGVSVGHLRERERGIQKEECYGGDESGEE